MPAGPGILHILGVVWQAIRGARSQQRAGSGDPDVVSAAAIRVAQTGSLLYRRMPSCRAAPWPGRLFSTSAQPISNRLGSLAPARSVLRTFAPLRRAKPFRRFPSGSSQQISNLRYAKKIRGPGPWSLGIYLPQRGSVPQPNVVPRLRDYVGLSR